MQSHIIPNLANTSTKLQTEIQIYTTEEDEIDAVSNQRQQDDSTEIQISSIYYGSDDQRATVVVDRPPPEPPDLHSVAVGEGEPGLSVSTAEESSRRPENLETVIAIHSGAEDSAVAKGNVVDVGSTDLNRGSSAVVGASAEGMWTATDKTTAATVADGSLRARRLRRFFSLMSPPLLAAIFPWDRGGEYIDNDLQWWPDVSAEDRANATEVGRVGRQLGRAKYGDGGATQWLAEQGLLLSSFGNGEQARKGLLSTVTAMANPRAQARGGCCGLGPAVVELAMARVVAYRWGKLERGGCCCYGAYLHLSKQSEGAILILNFDLGLLLVIQAQCSSLWLITGPRFIEKYFEKLVGSVFFKQWDPGGPFYFWAVV
ncbi:hypothetical protein PIB30_003932 [Stylosanthes scabra]|uniref:Uncharacterized protein n=1 Tax=Stylosanthes scabra TaxID=79078 RepID=A0ABU6V2H8_9FABA|nr:hypothetical protein [Stylosanthes scabra]